MLHFFIGNQLKNIASFYFSTGFFVVYSHYILKQVSICKGFADAVEDSL